MEIGDRASVVRPFNDGWGIRTLAEGEVRFNPMSYHNGSVWPHDTELCAAGKANYGNRGAAAHLLSPLFAASMHFATRLPEPSDILISNPPVF